MARCPISNPDPDVFGSHAAKNASKNGRTGKTSATPSTPEGISLSGMKTPDTK